ncbi:MAG: hypothetical protein EXS42_03600 [Lacunisphaera sp.]|nr:hypothetical protein [Lacunisphaera sp.]
MGCRRGAGAAHSRSARPIFALTPWAGLLRRTPRTLRFGGLTPGEILYAGDSLHHDVSGVRSAGWHCVLVLRRKDAAKKEGMIRSLGELLEIMPGR